MPETLWWPADKGASAIERYMDWLRSERGLAFDDYDSLWAWSVEDLDGFWSSIWKWMDIRAHTPYEVVLSDRSMPGAQWFCGATLNYAEHVLRRRGSDVAVIARSESRADVELSWDELRDQVGRCRAGLLRVGVSMGDRVVGYLPNGPEALIAFLAAASIGAVWASCAPEFGARSVIDRFGRLEPVVLVATRSYRYRGKDFDRSAEFDTIRESLPTLVAIVEVDGVEGLGEPLVDAIGWADLLAEPAVLSYDAVPFDHPLYVLFSSGTTGLPKAIVHGHGGILVEHLKALVIHQDLGPNDRFFWFTTTGWMMWNLLVSGLATGASIVLFDGDPSHPNLETLWRLAADVRVTFFGASAPFLTTCLKAGLQLGDIGDLRAVRTIGSTGAPLPADGFRWVYSQLPEVWLTSIAGGTDVCTAFVGGVPILPVVAGEISCRYLGAAVDAFDAHGASVRNEEGELVVTEPMPSMPLRFWDDRDGTAYRSSYFDRFPGVWCHGDWLTITDRGSCIITGRSDATLNRGGVRLGTSEFYEVVEALPDIADSLVVHLEGQGNGEILLFVQTAPGTLLDGRLRELIVSVLRTGLSPRHIPDEIYAVPAIPRTHSGKKLEVPMKRILMGARSEDALTAGGLANQSALHAFEAIRDSRAHPAT